MYVNREYNNRELKKRCYHKDEYLIELWNIENMRVFDMDKIDVIKLGYGTEEQWKLRYYNHYYKINNKYEDYINLICKEYLKGILWVAKYYFEDCPDWRWQMIYDNAPFISDVYKYYTTSNFEINNIEFTKNKNLPILTQLLSVLPPSSVNVLPESYRYLILSDISPIIDMFPKKIKLDMINKDQFWKCVPILPLLEDERILKVTKDIKLNKYEKIRNSDYDDFVI